MSASSSAAAAGPDPAAVKTPSDCPKSSAAPGSPEEPAKEEVKLPPLTPTEFRQYNHMAEHMDMFHNHFRQTWNLLWSACENNRRPAGMSLKAFINAGLQFVQHLTMHHNIEEAHIFPVLARKMPEFKAGRGNGAAELLRQHREIHKGMDLLEAYLSSCRSGECELELAVLKTKMESWGTVLWAHLDQEVKTLGAENMRKYWTVEEMRRMPM
ncbi:hypothetical protein BX600DRAFT_433326 [Xylariales sp. PMI_506]|nr:hypothetical protein BX600DRAFT_433326 [Xylariales sp. PMI_506]